MNSCIRNSLDTYIETVVYTYILSKNENKTLFHLAIAGGTASLLFKVSYMTLIHFSFSKIILKDTG